MKKTQPIKDDALKIQRLVDGAREDLNEKNIEAVFIALQMIFSAAERIAVNAVSTQISISAHNTTTGRA